MGAYITCRPGDFIAHAIVGFRCHISRQLHHLVSGLLKSSVQITCHRCGRRKINGRLRESGRPGCYSIGVIDFPWLDTIDRYGTPDSRAAKRTELEIAHISQSGR
jgi:hypothetical protein